jgi:arabinofuranosyltransferase
MIIGEVGRRYAGRLGWAERLRFVAPLLVALPLPLVMLAFVQLAPVDDAYISYRYAANLVHGHGLVFNRGEYVEGYTNLLWTLLSAVPIALGVSVSAFAALAGVVFGLLAMVDAWRTCCRLGVSPWAGFGAIVALALYADFWLVTTNGLEGGLFAFLLAHMLYLVLAGGNPLLAGLCGGLLFLTRPESCLLLPVVAVYLFITERKQPRRLALMLGLWLALVAVATLWRLFYYESWLPNTIVAKLLPSGGNTGGIRQNIGRGISYMRGFVSSTYLLTLGAALAIVFRPRSIAVWFCAALLGPPLAVVLVNGGDWMAHYRLLSTFVAVLVVLLSVTLHGVIQLSQGAAIPLRYLGYTAVVLTIAAGIGTTLSRINWRRTVGFEMASAAPCWEIAANTIKPALAQDDRVSPEVLGLFSYILADTYSHDMLGLTDRYVASHGTLYSPTYGKIDPEYTFHFIKPTLLVFHSSLRALPMWIAQASGGRYNDEYATYQLGFPVGSGCEDKRLFISLRSDSVARLLPTLAALGPQRVIVPIAGGQ